MEWESFHVLNFIFQNGELFFLVLCTTNNELDEVRFFHSRHFLHIAPHLKLECFEVMLSHVLLNIQY